jgi:pimeloyl-ACP methyl ester carboxylesterase
VGTFPRPTFGTPLATELASRGYRMLWVTPWTMDENPFDGVPELSKGISYMRSLPGVERVVVIGHSGGGRLVSFYANVALNGPAACQRPELLYPCKTEEASGLAKLDGLILMDSSAGTINTVSSVDPAYEGDSRTNGDLDMYAAANGYDAATGAAKYPEDFQKRFYAAQAARNTRLIDGAVAQLKLLDQGKSLYIGDAPMVIPGAVNNVNGTSLHHTDRTLWAHTKRPHTLLKADGSKPEIIVPIVAPPAGKENIRQSGSLYFGSLNYTVRHFLANDAIRTTKDFAITADDIVGVDWKSSLRSSPGNAEGITVPTLVMTMTCNLLVVPDEIIYDHLGAKDKTFAAVEGALHGFTPCRPEYGDTMKRAFDFVDNWLSKPGRF